MTRKRLPTPPSSRYLTPEGADRLRQELDRLWRIERPQVTQAVAEAAAMGDRSENAEYVYGKKRLREIDRRIRYLQKRLADVVIVDRIPDDQLRIFFGAWVQLQDDSGEVCIYRLVGADEVDPEHGLISIDAPLARALLKKTVHDIVTVSLPQGLTVFTVLSVRYRPFDRN